ncbi:nuclear polyadenylated RNA-binding protein 3 [Collariella sp. IMI 366227]|nr:nuclear polyadenylated RNA-binding protein 3 [Collariella sp. IMI 366227]
MPELSPKIVAADLSPVSPTPISVQAASQDTVASKLQAQAAQPALTPAIQSSPTNPPTMEAHPESTKISDTIVVAGDYSEESHDESDDSIDYGEGEEGQEQEQVDSDAVVDDYARTFDSPAAHENLNQAEADADQSDVQTAEESMNSSSAPAPLTSQSPAASNQSSPSPPPSLPPADGAPQAAAILALSEQPKTFATSPEAPSAAPNASPSSMALPTVPTVEAPQQPTPATSAPEARAAPAASPAPDSPPSNEDDAAVDIQKLVDDITARAAATASPSNAPAQVSPATQPAPAHRMARTLQMKAIHAPSGNYHAMSIKQRWEQFQIDEKRYTSEARWERFPEGSRIFIGNLSSERVSKREVFDVFNRFGRLAQISLKNAYGFVQYHTIAEGNAAMQAVQGIELGGRRIHLEISRSQKSKKDEREGSPERRGPRGPRGPERFDSGDRGHRRDDYRPGRSPSPRRNDTRGSRDGPFQRDRGFGTHDRRRSRSPQRHNRHGDDSYRRRSPSPHRRAPSDGDRLDLPRRFGADVPDVEILLLQEVSRDFVGWVQGAFHNRGLKTDVMYLNPRFPRDAVVQRQVLEGVHAIVDLDYAAQSQGKISIQVFIRSGGSSVRFETYQAIDPPIAAELAFREKSQSAAQAAPPPQPAYQPNYNHQPYQKEAPPVGYPYQYPPQHAPVPAPPQPPAQTPDLGALVGQLDNTALQALLASLQAPQAAPAHGHPGVPPQQPGQIDMNALLGNLRSAAAAPQPAPVPGYGAPQAYAQPVAHAAGVPNGYGGDTAQQVQTIIDQLKRAAQ